MKSTKALLAVACLVAALVGANAFTTSASMSDEPTPRTGAVLDSQSTFVEMTPCRLVDTRPESDDNKALVQAEGAIGQDQSRAYNGAGACGVPSNATALSVNLTSVSPTVQTVLTLWDTGAARPGASTLNPDPLLTVSANTTNVALGTSGKFNIHNEWGQVHYVIDVLGYYVDGFGTSAIPNLPNTGDGFSLIIEHQELVNSSVGLVGFYSKTYRGTVVNLENEARWVGMATATGCPAYTYESDGMQLGGAAKPIGTKVSMGAHWGFWVRVEARSTAPINFASACSGPSDAVTETGGSLLEAINSETFATFELTLPISEYAEPIVEGAVGASVFTASAEYESTSRTGAVLDSQSTFVEMTPCRLVDTRPESDDNKALVQAEGAIGQDESRAYSGAGACGVPSNATALSVNLTSVSPTVQTVLTLWDTGAARPGASTLNPDPLLTVSANTTNVALGTSGKFNIHNEWGQVDYVIDVLGYYVDGFGTSAIPNLPNTGDGFSLIIEHQELEKFRFENSEEGNYAMTYWGAVVNLENEARWFGMATATGCPAYTYEHNGGPLDGQSYTWPAVQIGEQTYEISPFESWMRVEALSTAPVKWTGRCIGPSDAVTETGVPMREVVTSETFATFELTLPTSEYAEPIVEGAVGASVFTASAEYESTSRTGAELDSQSTFVEMTPCRLVDTRPESDDNKALVQAEGAIGQDQSRAYNGAGACGVPSNATSLSVNLTSVSPTVQTVLTLWDTGAARPGASTLNPDPLLTVSANTTNVALGTSGKFNIHNEWGQVHYVIDVLGYYVDGFGTSAIPNLPNTGDGFSLIIEHQELRKFPIGNSEEGDYLKVHWGTVVNLENEARWVGMATATGCPAYTSEFGGRAATPIGTQFSIGPEGAWVRVEARSTAAVYWVGACQGPSDAVTETGVPMREVVTSETFATKEFSPD